MPYRATCPVCFTIDSIYRTDVKTCSGECSRAWRRMSRSEQQARLREVDPVARLERLRRLDNVTNIADHPDFETPPADKFDRSQVDPSLHMPKGIIPEPEGDLLKDLEHPIRKPDDNSSEND